MADIIQFPTAHEPQPDPQAPTVIRIVLDVPEQPAQPAITLAGIVVAILAAVASFAIVTAVLS